jgi:hypothetical protein
MLSRRAVLAAIGAVPFLPMRAAAGPMSYLSDSEHAALIADPTAIQTLYPLKRQRFLADLGPGFSAEIEEHLKFAFCGLVAFDLKPYGASKAITMEELRSAPALDCDNYAILHWRLFELLVPDSTTNVAALGWNGGPIGNHAQMIAHKPADANGSGGGAMFVDPTTGIILCGHDFDWIASGRKVNQYYLKDFYASCGRVGTITDSLHGQVLEALARGLYRPSQLLYYYVDLDRYIAPVPNFADWMTPQASALSP